MHRLEICTILFTMNWEVDYWVNSFYSLVSLQTVKIHEETSFASKHFNVMWTNGHNLQFLWCTAIKQWFSSFSCLGKSQFLTIGPFLHKRSWRIFFKMHNYLSLICIMLLCSIFADPVTYNKAAKTVVQVLQWQLLFIFIWVSMGYVHLSNDEICIPVSLAGVIRCFSVIESQKSLLWKLDL